MNITCMHPTRHVPRRLYCQPACMLDFPSCTEVSDAWSVAGSGIRSGSNSLKTALGEYYERKHFYTEILSDTQNKLTYSLRPDEAYQFVHAFSQTSYPTRQLDNLLEHTYHLTKVIRISDLTECYIPTACLSLTHYGLGEDNTIYPLRDTCGCSFHWDAKKAIFCALKECLERQFLNRFWLTAHYQKRISAQSIIDQLTKSNILALASSLNKAGDIIAFDISDPSFPGRCIIACYGQKNRSHHVNYCTGMAYSDTQTHALEKAFEELWQTYRFMDLFTHCKGDKNTLKDPYLKHFFNCNTYESFKEITSCEAGCRSTSQLARRFTTNELLNSLAHQKIQGYLYLKPSHIEDKRCVFCKFISPQLFMHMNNSRHINLDNDYSAIFQGDILPSRQTNMVPFP